MSSQSSVRVFPTYSTSALEAPAPSKIKDVAHDENEVVVLVEVYMPVIRLAHENRSVNRTVTLPAWLNARACEIGVNFSQVLQAALIRELKLNEE